MRLYMSEILMWEMIRKIQKQPRNGLLCEEVYMKVSECLLALKSSCYQKGAILNNGFFVFLASRKCFKIMCNITV